MKTQVPSNPMVVGETAYELLFHEEANQYAVRRSADLRIVLLLDTTEHGELVPVTASADLDGERTMLLLLAAYGSLRL
jgi:hypothetical protein